jgi:hypothetical protein
MTIKEGVSGDTGKNLKERITKTKNKCERSLGRN